MPKSQQGNMSIYPVKKDSPSKGKIPDVGKPPKASTVEAFKGKNK